MKIIKIICTAALFITIGSCNSNDDLVVTMPCIPTVGLEASIIAFYPFTNGSLNDIAGNGENLANTTGASPTSDRNGNANCAYEFDNLPMSSEFLTTTNTTFLNGLNEFSISLWYQPLDISRGGGDFESLINRDLGPACPDRNGQWSVALYDCRKAVFGRTNSVWDTHIVPNFDCDLEVIERTDSWNHLVATFKQNGVEMKIYRNGTLQASSAGDADCGVWFGGIATSQDIGDLFLGKDYTGKIDDVIIFNKTLSQAQVNTLFGMDTCCE